MQEWPGAEAISQEDFDLYRNCLHEIKDRMSIARRYLEGSLTTGYAVADLESACLQTRKVLELIALGSLVVNIGV